MSAPRPADCQKPRGPWGSCIQALAAGWILVSDLCPVCMRAFMSALDGIAGPLEWHQGYRDRVAGSQVGDRHGG